MDEVAVWETSDGWMGVRMMSSIHASTAVDLKASQSSLGSMLRRNWRLYSVSFRCNSASLKCSGNDAGEVLQALTAQVTKLTVRIFIIRFRGWIEISDD